MSLKEYNYDVLIVEDDEILLKKLSEMLKPLLPNIYTASNGKEALEIFSNKHLTDNSIDLIITDIEMPIMNGFELIRQARKINSDIHAIIVSGLDFGYYIKDMNSIDILNFYLNKPIDFADLYSLIEHVFISIKRRKAYVEQYNLTQQYKSALDNSSIISKTDKDGNITYANDAFCNISGYTREELIGQNHRIVRHPDVPEKVFKKLWTLINAKMIFRHPSLPNKAKDGSTYYVNTTIFPILDKNGNVIEYISVRYETTPLINSMKEEKKAKESQRIFLANMSHEIRTPLSGILGFSKLLENSSLNPQDMEYVKIINSSADNLLHTINEILDFSKIQTGKMTVENIYFNAYEELKQIKELFDAKAVEKKIELLFNAPENLTDILVYSDILKIKQALSNLVNNAIKFTDIEGRISLNIIQKSIYADKITLEFSVLDNGIGIDENKLGDIFNPFIQENQSTSREYGGTGLGLSITKDIINLIGGELKVTSSKNVGSKFYFELVLDYKQNDNSEIEKDNVKEENVKFSGNILVAEDVEINRKLIKKLLENAGLNVTFANNGLEATNIFNKGNNNFNLIFLDINMPIMDGLDAYTIIEKDNKNNIPVIALTANAIKGDKEKFLEHGFDDYLSKPIDFIELNKVLNKFLSTSKVDEKKETTNNKIDLEINDIVNKNAKKLDIPEDFYLELLNDFKDSIDEDIKLLEEYIINNDKVNISSQAHKIKGVSANLYLEELAEILKKVEYESLNTEEYTTLVEKSKVIINALKEAISK